MYSQLGYDYAPLWPTWINHPDPASRITADTAERSRGERKWVEEGRGLINTWEDLERFPWETIKPDSRPIECAARQLPEGMKLVLCGTHFEHVFEKLIGFEGMSYMLYDEPKLAAQVFERWGQIVYDFYAAFIDMDAIGAIFHADDLGFKTSTLISPALLRQLTLPWQKQYAALAHDRGKPFWLHSCGNLYRQGIIEDLIDDVRIDALHSFQDEILPVTDFKARYGGRVATLGGVDMDKIARLDEEPLRAYVRDILADCMPGGRYALGTGNTVANYIPLKNFVIMLEESRKWQAA
jgi:uroporphyrinogen decarboxylase